MLLQTVLQISPYVVLKGLFFLMTFEQKLHATAANITASLDDLPSNWTTANPQTVDPKPYGQLGTSPDRSSPNTLSTSSVTEEVTTLSFIQVTQNIMAECFQKRNGLLTFRIDSGTIRFHGSLSEDIDCHLKLTGLPETVYQFTFRTLPSCDVVRLIITDKNGAKNDVLDTVDCPRITGQLYTFTNIVEVKMFVYSADTFSVELNFTSLPRTSLPSLEINYTTPMRGYIQTPGWDGQMPHPSVMDTCFNLQAPAEQAIMLSFLSVDIARSNDACESNFVAVHKGGNCQGKELIKSCNWPYPSPSIYNSSLLSVHFYSEVAQQYTGFRMFFSFHNQSALPERDADGKWNCSVPFLGDFKHHFICTLQPECYGGEDNALCSSRDFCGLDLVAVGNSCYRYVKPEYALSWNEARSACLRRGGHLASLVTPEQWQGVRDLLNMAKAVSSDHVFVGLQLASAALPDIYRKTWQWSNRRIAYFLNIQGYNSAQNFCAAFKSSAGLEFVSAVSCDRRLEADFLCEIALPEKDLLSIELKNPVNENNDDLALETKLVNLVRCPSNHTTHAFLGCDLESDCWGKMDDSVFLCEDWGQPVTFAPSFRCGAGGEQVPYTLVCDHHPDCCDKSDENFCFFPSCDPLTQLNCGNNQCISRTERCDGIKNCLTGVDEQLCRPRLETIHVNTLPPPAAIYFDGRGNFTVSPLANVSACPATHFRCSDDGYCVPVYTRCNGVYDCPTGIDEDGCNKYECPGFYRCRGSKICVHMDHLCDGVFQCPQRDDELFCNMTCPPGCTCYGWAFYCSRVFSTGDYLNLRYLDAQGTGMRPGTLVNNIMLVHLSLARCNLKELDVLTFPNLHSLDLSYNNLRVIRTSHLSNLVNLRSLYLTKNPIVDCFPEFATSADFKSLTTLDMSQIYLGEMQSFLFKLFPNVKNLNLSNSGMFRVNEPGFQPLKNLRQLDLRGCPIKDFTRDVFQGLNKLTTVYTENYKLCCSATLPDGFNVNNCHAPSDEISSCDSLLRNELFRVFLTIFALMTLVGNASSFIYRVFVKRVGSHMGFDVFVTNLCVADFIMGVYLVIIGSADAHYKGTYLWNDVSWKRSAACKAAGFLCLLSSEVSAFIICLITAERFIVLRFPLSTFRFRGRSAQLACTIAWAVGFGLAGVPLFPFAVDWEFYGQTGICIPLPITRNDFLGHDYAKGLMIVLNFVLFILIVVGQALIYWSVRFNGSIANATNKVSESTVARRLLTIVISEFLCWFPIGVLGLLASYDVPIPGKVNVAMAIFVLPLNSALNPFLYTLNVMMEKRTKAREEKLLKTLVCRLQSLNSEKTYVCSGSSSGTNGTERVCLSEIVTSDRL